ncbi:carboxypeptidase-like regulatory domain-containing protein [Leptolyngbya sp. 7M]|uniref:carboxypeptidase-like regulatory domain-containing protein n=1 Tax=Leptolyngbya sp. 7M TaxID=2812896 RepID=UPI001B8CC152|nr:carboxypeptidase-like regulatory domain-containing protein [Leptolyngbya sp. 7M]QYO67655.1 carboxypeptidase-like regulatory domain-containing protein [Leptolyngbya sp. 7M]
MPENRAGRWWQIENPGGGVTLADLYFGYQDSDYIGVEPNFSAYRISSGTAELLKSSRSKSANFVEVLNVTNFSNWTLADVAAPVTSVSVGGRITTADGQAIRNVGVTITDISGVAPTVRTNTFGYYRFDGVRVGVSYDFTVSNNRYVFDPSSSTVFVTDEIAHLDGIGEEFEFK